MKIDAKTLEKLVWIIYKRFFIEKGKLKDIQIKIEYGVYACYVYVKDKKYLGVCNVGMRPTIDSQKTIEVNIIDFNKDIYGEIILIELIKKLRDIEKFNSLQEVKKQVDKDIIKTRELLS